MKKIDYTTVIILKCTVVFKKLVATAAHKREINLSEFVRQAIANRLRSGE